MTTSTLAFGRANAFVRRRWPNQFYSTSSSPSPAPAAATSKAADAAHQRELFVNVLNANATRRDAKPYLTRFKQGQSGKSRTLPSAGQSQRAAAKRGPFHTPTRAIAENPQFIQQGIEEEAIAVPKETIHVALVFVRSPRSMDDATLDGVGVTLSQLVKLDMRIIVVLDCHDTSEFLPGSAADVKQMAAMFTQKGARLSAAITGHSAEGARLVHGAFEVDSANLTSSSGTEKVTVGVPKLLLGPLERATIPIIPTLAYTASGQLVSCTASSIMAGLTFFLSGLSTKSNAPPASGSILTSLDRIILLDSLGGIPSMVRGDEAHVFINLEQEFTDIKHELTEYAQTTTKSSSDANHVYGQHISNLQMLQDCLSMLPSASSALIITPEEAASSSQTVPSVDHPASAGTRRQKNTLIHNLLTNKPMVSPSLPVARLPPTSPSNGNVDVSREAPRSTLVKRGMPLTIIPTVFRGEGWQAPATGESTIDLEHDPRVDLARLVHLIEDSFRRKLDVQHYLSRIRGRTAGLIVAGSYDGGAILTWEQPPGTSDPSRLVPYLDKFAVLSSSQGSAGVADILFQAMVRTCFPNGVCWRSRKDNPVNKWYFERADGHWQIPGTNWTMFWTGAGVVESKQRWDDYAAVCSSIGASWKDGKPPE